ncbi:MAG: 4Fe-4S binding protein [Candidatus Aenigmarchaeota archaeon]|nr:4Fe-4S binding protein [Candidatus Aenigmarchaeota archaeon]
MVKRKIIEIDEKKCNGCGQCIPGCPEGALQIIEGKARLVSDLFCDGLGACIGTCPSGAIKVIERQAEPYDERKVMEKIVKQGKNVIKAHLRHLKEHGQHEYLMEAVGFLHEKGIDNPIGWTKKTRKPSMPCGCPGSMVMDFGNRDVAEGKPDDSPKHGQKSELRQWPVQLMLVPPHSPYLEDSHLLISADCVPFALPNFHQDYLRGRRLLVGCPKLDDIDLYREKLAEIFRSNNIRSATVLHMEVPCCFGLRHLVEEAVRDSGRKIGVDVKIIPVLVKGG